MSNSSDKRSLRSRITAGQLWCVSIATNLFALPVALSGLHEVSVPMNVIGFGALGLAWAVEGTIPAADVEKRKVEKFEDWLYKRDLPAYNASRIGEWTTKPVGDLSGSDTAARARAKFVQEYDGDVEKLEEELDYAFGIKTRPSIPAVWPARDPNWYSGTDYNTDLLTAAANQVKAEKAAEWRRFRGIDHNAVLRLREKQRSARDRHDAQAVAYYGKLLTEKVSRVDTPRYGGYDGCDCGKCRSDRHHPKYSGTLTP